MDQRCKCEVKNYKFLEKNIGGNPNGIWFGNDLLDMTSKAHATKTEIDELEYNKIKNPVH